MDEEYYTISGVVTLIGATVIAAGLFLSEPIGVSVGIIFVAVSLAALEWISERTITISLVAWSLLVISSTLSLVGDLYAVSFKGARTFIFLCVVVLAFILMAEDVFNINISGSSE